MHLELCSPLKNHHVSKVILEIRLILTVITASFVIIGACSVVERITSIGPGEDWRLVLILYMADDGLWKEWQHCRGWRLFGDSGSCYAAEGKLILGKNKK